MSGGSGNNIGTDIFTLTLPLAMKNLLSLSGNAQYTALCIAGSGPTQIALYGYNRSTGDYKYNIKGN